MLYGVSLLEVAECGNAALASDELSSQPSVCAGLARRSGCASSPKVHRLTRLPAKAKASQTMLLAALAVAQSASSHHPSTTTTTRLHTFSSHHPSIHHPTARHLPTATMVWMPFIQSFEGEADVLRDLAFPTRSENEDAAPRNNS